MSQSFVDIHCHLLPGIDDGAADLAAALAMARMAVAEGVGTVIATPHQLGSYQHNAAADIRRRVAELQAHLDAAGIPLRVLPGADIRIEDCLVERIASGQVLTLGDHGRHVLLELPHELYFPLEGLLESLQRRRLVGILSHPERNAGLQRRPETIAPLVAAGCLMQVTAGSYTGAFGPGPLQLAEWMLARNLVHFVATDAHGPERRRPLVRRAIERVAELAGREMALALVRDNPGCVARGADVPAAATPPTTRTKFSWRQLLARKAG